MHLILATKYTYKLSIVFISCLSYISAFTIKAINLSTLYSYNRLKRKVGLNTNFIESCYIKYSNEKLNYLGGSLLSTRGFRYKTAFGCKWYSTSTKSTNTTSLNVINSKSIKFDSLELAWDKIKYKFIGVSGVYKLTNINNRDRFYIGSSTNLARRMEEYLNIIKGIRNPHSFGEIEISKTSASEWALEFIYITHPLLSLVFEQYAIIKFKPTINSYFKVTPRINPQFASNGMLDKAIIVIEELLSLFIVGSDGHKRLSVFLQTFKVASKIKLDSTLDPTAGIGENSFNMAQSFLVFVYDINLPNENPIIYSSLNRAIKGLKITYSNLFNHVNNKYLFQDKFILSFEPLSNQEIANSSFWQIKPKGDNQLRKHVTLYNKYNQLFMEFKSGREMARFFKIDGKVARTAIAQGEFRDFLLLTKEISFRKSIYVFDSNTHKLVNKFSSYTKALEYAKVGFYNLKSLIETGNSHEGKIYSYKDKL